MLREAPSFLRNLLNRHIIDIDALSSGPVMDATTWDQVGSNDYVDTVKNHEGLPPQLYRWHQYADTYQMFRTNIVLMWQNTLRIYAIKLARASFGPNVTLKDAKDYVEALCGDVRDEPVTVDDGRRVGDILHALHRNGV